MQTSDRAVRGNRGEVHRGCGDGRLGHAGGDGGRRGARGAGGARARRGGVDAGAGGERRGPSRSRGGADRRGRGDDRRHGRGDGRRGSGQHRLEGAVGRGTRPCLRRRLDSALDRAGDRLRGRGLVRAEGQAGLDAALEGGARGLRRPRDAQVAGPGGAVRRQGPGTASDQRLYTIAQRRRGSR